MKKLWEYIKNHRNKVIVSILILLSIIFFISFISTVEKYKRSGELGIDYRINGQPTYRHHKARLNDIRTWMTFNYINVIFKLHPDYLKNMFNISDPQYPNIRIDRYLKRNNINPIEFQIKLEEAITNYTELR